MTTIYIYTTINTLCFDGRWSYGMGKLRKALKLEEDYSTLTAYKKKKTLLDAVATVDQGNYVIKGRSGKYVACDKETGRPTWYIYLEDEAELRG